MEHPSVFSGNLSFLSIPDLFQLIGANTGTGALHLRSKFTGGEAVIYFVDGNPVNAQCGRLSGIEAIHYLFGWAQGEFEFREEKVSVARVIHQGRMELILNSLKMLDDGLIERLDQGPESVEGAGPEVPKEKIPVVRGPMVDYMDVVEEEEFYARGRIVQEGRYGNWIWVVLEGAVDIVRETEEGPLRIIRIGEGGFIGSLASFLVRGNIRSASAIAVTKVQLGVLDLARLSKEYSALSIEFRDFLVSLDRRLRQVTDRVVDYHLKRDNLHEFMEGRKPLFKQGEPDDRLYMIGNGSASVVRYLDAGCVPLCRLKPGDFFGSVPFLNLGQEPFSAAVLSTDDFKFVQIDEKRLQRDYDHLSSTFKNMIDHFSNSISATTMLACELYRQLQPGAS